LDFEAPDEGVSVLVELFESELLESFESELDFDESSLACLPPPSPDSLSSRERLRVP
jgi:hypothetical protein